MAPKKGKTQRFVTVRHTVHYLPCCTAKPKVHANWERVFLILQSDVARATEFVGANRSPVRSGSIVAPENCLQETQAVFFGQVGKRFH
jgi:hypothetical protein